MTPMPRSLHVFLYGTHIGAITPRPGSMLEYRFTKDVDPRATLSLSLPTIPGRRYNADLASPFFNGILPDGADARLRMAQSLGTLDTTAFNLLDRAGLDCAGAVQFYREPTLPERAAGNLIEISEKAIGQRLRAMISGQSSVERGDTEHWSVSGAQTKTALRRENGRWFRATGSEPHSHIVKPGIANVSGVHPEEQALVEHATMTAARQIGVKTARTEFTEFDGVGAVVVERFDRYSAPDGTLERIHQEDLCQATGTHPSNKYETDGGPGVGRIARLLRESTTDRSLALSHLRSFADMVIVNLLACASDGHAKNYALIHHRDGAVELAPMYDAASGANSVLDDASPRFPNAAMLTGSVRAFSDVAHVDWASLDRDLGLGDECHGRALTIARALPDALSDAINHSGARTELVRRLRATPLLPRVSAVCKKISRS